MKACRNGLEKKFYLTILHHVSMRTNRNIYTASQSLSALLMIMALLWLTVSLPFTYASQHQLAGKDSIEKNLTAFPSSEEESCNPFSGSEEKAPTSGSQVSEEYLHDHHKSEYFFTIVSTFHKLENAGTYIAFHGELLVPPPNAS